MGFFRELFGRNSLVQLKRDFHRRDATEAAIVARMRWKPTPDDSFAVVPFKFIHAHESTDCYWVIVGIEGRDPVVIKDDKDLFPSDLLVTQLRLLEKQ